MIAPQGPGSLLRRAPPTHRVHALCPRGPPLPFMDRRRAPCSRSLRPPACRHAQPRTFYAAVSVPVPRALGGPSGHPGSRRPRHAAGARQRPHCDAAGCARGQYRFMRRTNLTQPVGRHTHRTTWRRVGPRATRGRLARGWHPSPGAAARCRPLAAQAHSGARRAFLPGNPLAHASAGRPSSGCGPPWKSARPPDRTARRPGPAFCEPVHAPGAAQARRGAAAGTAGAGAGHRGCGLRRRPPSGGLQPGIPGRSPRQAIGPVCPRPVAFHRNGRAMLRQAVFRADDRPGMGGPGRPPRRWPESAGGPRPRKGPIQGRKGWSPGRADDVEHRAIGLYTGL